ncbi:DUF732 domain-containing protein [Nocardia tengchongensis]|uniref:DUF732 domain-containing protein n=1 Tax=Nocardia tengchongensis TaxID=2055889 RepID=A0ABX8CX13_9NOCA|nr:DUF732 domain-containing protein [Nocardia tengchongensis]QVI22705.1 DUF732 domain-containing protein [Nocardia tengchongensis]
MHGTRGKVFGVVAALAAVGLLAACGSNDSTAKSTPTLTTTKTTAAASGAATPSSDQQAPQAAPDGSTSTERPAPIPSQFLTTPPGSPALTDKEKGFLEELKKAGITPGSTDIAITAANLVCQGKAENAPQDQIITYVTAIAGSDPAFDPAKMSVEQAGKTYFDVASKSYCNK